MLNRISGWCLFAQASYLAVFITLAAIDVVSRGVVYKTVAATRPSFGLQNTYFRLSDYVTYPLALTAPLNLILMLAFFWTVLRCSARPSLSDHFFSLCNTMYVVGSGWVLFAVFLNILHK